MTQHAHTPGPWTYVALDDSDKFNIIAHGPIARTGDNGNGMENAEANAALIAAAPALLEACEAALDELVKLQDQRHHNTPDGLGVIISLRAAIAQARNV